MPVHERVRDMIYIEELNKIFLFLESYGTLTAQGFVANPKLTPGSIGVLEVDN